MSSQRGFFRLVAICSTVALLHRFATIMNVGVASEKQLQGRAAQLHTPVGEEQGPAAPVAVPLAVVVPVLSCMESRLKSQRLLEWQKMKRSWRKYSGQAWRADPVNCCGPWLCAYYKNRKFVGEPAAMVQMSSLGTGWQKKNGYGFDGVPALGFRKKDFSMKCMLVKNFEAGQYAFIPFIRAASKRLFFDGKLLHDGGNQGGGVITDNEVLLAVSRGQHVLQLDVAVYTEPRAWAMLTWVRVRSELLTPLQRVACIASARCYGRKAVCRERITQGLGPGEAPWGLCKTYMQPAVKCIVYSVGIRNIYQNELLMGRHGCEVHAFDCTMNHPTTLGPNVTFHPWCLGTSSSELLLDGKKDAMQTNAKNKAFMSLPQIVKRLGHEDSELTVLKMDCEGCEWAALDILYAELPAFYNRIAMMMLEIHMVTNPKAKDYNVQKELGTKTRAAASLRNFRVYQASINSDTSSSRFSSDMFYPQLVHNGIHNGTCCYEFSFVREDLAMYDDTTAKVSPFKFGGDLHQHGFHDPSLVVPKCA